MQTARKRLTGRVVALQGHPMSGAAVLVLETKNGKAHIPCERRMTIEALHLCFDGEPAEGKKVWYETDTTGVLSVVGPEKPSPNRPLRFMGPEGRGFKLVVFAPSLAKARAYVKAQAISSKAHRALKFVGEGHPPNPEDWCAAVVREGTE